MSPLKGIALCFTLGLALFSIYLLVQNIMGAGSFAWFMLLGFAGFAIWVFLKLPLSKETPVS